MLVRSKLRFSRKEKQAVTLRLETKIIRCSFFLVPLKNMPEFHVQDHNLTILSFIQRRGRPMMTYWSKASF